MIDVSSERLRTDREKLETVAKFCKTTTKDGDLLVLND